MSNNERVHFKIALPVGLKKALEHHAVENRRSLSAEMIARLEASLAVGHLNPHDFLGIQQYEAENSKKLADALRRIAYSVEMLGSGALEFLDERPEDMPHNKPSD